MKSPHFQQTKLLRVDKPLLFTVLGLLVFGVIMVADASVVDAVRYFDDRLFFAKRQALWALAGLLAMFAVSQINYKVWARFANVAALGAIVMLVMVLVPGLGVSALGAKRWLEFGPVVIQPAEVAKLAACLFLAKIFAFRKNIVYGFAFVGAVLVLTMLEPDLGTSTIIFLIALVMYFVVGSPLYHFLALLPLTAIGFLAVFISDYRKARLLTFLDPSSDPLGSSYHIRQVILALGSGGLFGLGLGQSRQKYLFLPEPATDSIFAIIGEELGFVGSTMVIAAFAYFILRSFRLLQKVKDPFGKLLGIGLISWIAIQVCVNLAAMVALVPLTGVPLPFISYGGSALILNLIAVGILLNISREAKN